MKQLIRIWSWILSMLPKKKVKFAGVEHEIRYAFTCAGVDYYEFADPFNIPPHRGYHLLREWSLMKAKITEEYLAKQVEVVDAILQKDHKNVFEAKTEVKRINDQLKERLKYLAFDLENLYRVASVHYFTKDEHPEVYDLDLAVKKITSWKKNTTVEDFFLQQPLVRLFPFLEGQAENLKNYEEVVSKLNSLHLGNLSNVI